MSDEESYEYEYDDDSDEEMDDGDNNDDDNNNSDDDDDDGNSDFEYTDDEEEVDDIDVALENSYYNAKGVCDSSVQEKVDAFEAVIVMENEALGKEKGQTDDNDNDDDDGTTDATGDGGSYYGPWSFKALKQLVKLRLRNAEYQQASTYYTRLLGCISSPRSEGVSPNAVEKGVNAMLERIASIFQGSHYINNNDNNNKPSSQEKDDDTMDESSNTTTTVTNHQELARHVYDTTLKLFHPTSGHFPNERLWTKTNLKYGQLLYDMNEPSKLQTVIKDLLKTVQSTQDGNVNSNTSSSSYSTNLMEIYKLQIQYYSKLKDHKNLRIIRSKALQIKNGIPHPRTLALIQEHGGKMHMAAREFSQARSAFFQAFKSYDEAGDSARLRCLKYLVMASMLQASGINPFDSQEVRPYRNDGEIVAMTKLMEAFQSNEIQTFERILSRNEGKLMDDEFIRENLEDLLRTIRTQVLQQVIRPYTRISLSAISKELNGIPIKDVESLLVTLILDGKSHGRIDQVNGVLIKDVERGSGGSGGVSSSDGTNANGGGSGVGGSGSSGSGTGGGSTNASGAYLSSSANVDANGNPTSAGGHRLLSTGGPIPVWAGDSVQLKTSAAMNSLIGELEKQTILVANTAAATPHQYY